MTAQERILQALRVGENNAVSLADMCNIVGLHNRDTRLIIEYLRRSGVVICSSNNGYYYPADIAELRRYVQKERARENSIAETLKPAEKLLHEWQWGKSI
ncbi:MAG: hypothetical protein ACI4I6_08635 [Hominimerdicola sp.]